MQKFIETTGDTRDAAIEAALKQLGMDRDDVSVEVLDNGKKGFLGIGATPARVRVPSGKIRMFSPASSLRVISSSVSREPSFDM